MQAGYETAMVKPEEIAEVIAYSRILPAAEKGALRNYLNARYALAKNPNAKFAVISHNDDYGRDYLAGLKDVLG